MRSKPRERSSMTSALNKLVRGTVLCLTVLASTVHASTPEPPATPRDYVVDLAGVIGADVQNQLNAYLRELEDKTTAQVVVLTVKSLDNEDITSFSLKTAEKWKLGQKGKDNGVLDRRRGNRPSIPDRGRLRARKHFAGQPGRFPRARLFCPLFQERRLRRRDLRGDPRGHHDDCDA